MIKQLTGQTDEEDMTNKEIIEKDFEYAGAGKWNDGVIYSARIWSIRSSSRVV